MSAINVMLVFIYPSKTSQGLLLFHMNECSFVVQALYKAQVKELKEEVEEKGKQVQDQEAKLKVVLQERWVACLWQSSVP